MGLAAYLAKKELMWSTPAAGGFDPGAAAAADFSSPTAGRFAIRRGGAKGVFGNTGAARLPLPLPKKARISRPGGFFVAAFTLYFFKKLIDPGWPAAHRAHHSLPRPAESGIPNDAVAAMPPFRPNPHPGSLHNRVCFRACSERNDACFLDACFLAARVSSETPDPIRRDLGLFFSGPDLGTDSG